MSRNLSIGDQSKLNALERVIERTKASFVECGEALLQIHDEKLYLRHGDTFDEYCQRRWGWQRAHAYRLMNAAGVHKSLENNEGVSPIGDTVNNEAQARELKKVPAKNRAEVIKSATKNGKVTAKSLGEEAKKLEVVTVYDKDGYPIPAPALPAWNRRDEMLELWKLIKSTRDTIRKLDRDDVMLVEVNLQSVIADLTNAASNFEQSVPQHCCSMCQGQTPKTCAFCKGRGVVSDFRWITVPAELKEMRKAASK